MDKPPLLTPDKIDTVVAERKKKQAAKAKGRKGGRRQRSESKAAPADAVRRKQSDILMDAAMAAELFHATDGDGYADIEVDGHRETWPIRSRGFRHWLSQCFFDDSGGAPGSEALQASLNALEAKARFKAPERKVFIRVGELDGRIYLDLCDTLWRAVEIDAQGWRIVDRPLIRFCRTKTMRPLPVPERDGSIESLRPLLNIPGDEGGDDDFVLTVASLLAWLRGRGPYPIDVVGGEQGSAKSMRSKILKTLVDAHVPALQALPRNEHELFIAAGNRHVLAFDNISGLPPWLSDALCRLASGAGFSTRKLYEGREEEVFDGARPIILNGIEDIVERPDLGERALFFMCEPIRDENRRTEDELWAAFEASWPSVLGALLDAVAMGLTRLPETRPPRLPRMADFAQWAIACETALWKPGTFQRAYDSNILNAVESVLEANPVAVAVRDLAATGRWEGTAADLLNKLAGRVDERTIKLKSWPATPRGMSGSLRRAATLLRKAGVHIEFVKEGHKRTRKIVIGEDVDLNENKGLWDKGADAAPEVRKIPSAPSAPSAVDDDPIRKQ